MRWPWTSNKIPESPPQPEVKVPENMESFGLEPVPLLQLPYFVVDLAGELEQRGCQIDKLNMRIEALEEKIAERRK